MKKLVCLLLALIMVTTMFVGCNTTDPGVASDDKHLPIRAIIPALKQT